MLKVRDGHKGDMFFVTRYNYDKEDGYEIVRVFYQSSAANEYVKENQRIGERDESK